MNILQLYTNTLSAYDTSFLLRMLGICLIASIIGIAFSLSVAFAIRENAIALGIKKKTLFFVLAIFFPIIVGIVYLCCRKDAEKIQPKMCMNCGTTVNSITKQCPNCTSVNFVDYTIVNADKHKSKSRILLIVAVVLLVVRIIFSNIIPVFMQDYIQYFGNNYKSNPYTYNYNFGDKNSNNKSYGSADDLNDFFNNFEGLE